MQPNTAPLNCASGLEALQKNPAALDWPARRDLVREIARALRAGPPRQELLDLCRLLAGDPKWEVRNAVADLLCDLPRQECQALTDRLRKDNHHYVKQAANRAQALQARRDRAAKRRRTAADEMQQEFAAIEEQHGADAAKQACAAAEKRFSALVSAVAHDARTLWIGIANHLDTVLRRAKQGKPLPQEQQASVIKAREQVHLLSKYFDDLQAFAIVLNEPRTPERMRLLVEEAVSIVQSRPREPGPTPPPTQVRINVPEGLTAEVTKRQILAALVNVLNNAFEALENRTDGKGCIEIAGVKRADHAVELIVADNGRGIAPEDLSDIREFVPGRTSKRVGGAGIGLPAAARYLQAHDGLLVLDSIEGKGTTVTMVVPKQGTGV